MLLVEKIPDEQEVCLDFVKRTKALREGGLGKEDRHMWFLGKLLLEKETYEIDSLK